MSFPTEKGASHASSVTCGSETPWTDAKENVATVHDHAGQPYEMQPFVLSEDCRKFERQFRALLSRCLPIVEADARMMADITRHAPLDPESQAKHDSTEYESERLAQEIPAALGFPNAAITQPGN